MRARVVPAGTTLVSAPSCASSASAGGSGSLGIPAQFVNQRQEIAWIPPADQPVTRRNSDFLTAGSPEDEVCVGRREPRRRVERMEVRQVWRDRAEAGDGVLSVIGELKAGQPPAPLDANAEERASRQSLAYATWINA